MASFNTISSSALSLEGKRFWIIRSMPISAETFLFAKTVPAAAPYLFSPAIGVITMVYSMIVMPIVSRLTKTPSPEMVEAAFDAAKKREKDQAKEIQEQA